MNDSAIDQPRPIVKGFKFVGPDIYLKTRNIATQSDVPTRAFRNSCVISKVMMSDVGTKVAKSISFKSWVTM